MTETLFAILIEESDPNDPFIQAYWAYAEHLGVALERVTKAARSNGLQSPRWRQADPYDLANLDAPVEHSADGRVFWSTTQHHFPPEPFIQLPYGVISSCIDGEFDVDEIRCGYASTIKSGLITIQAVVSDKTLLEDYVALLHACGDLRVFWYKVHDHWEQGEPDRLFTNESLAKPELIDARLRRHEYDGLRNGFVTLTSFANTGATNINISDHKTIVIMTRSPNMAEKLTECLSARGYESLDRFISIDRGIHHWHFRDPRGLARRPLIERLLQSGFNEWQPK